MLLDAAANVEVKSRYDAHAMLDYFQTPRGFRPLLTCLSIVYGDDLDILSRNNYLLARRSLAFTWRYHYRSARPPAAARFLRTLFDIGICPLFSIFECPLDDNSCHALHSPLKIYMTRVTRHGSLPQNRSFF